MELPYILQIFNVSEEMFWSVTDEDTKCDLIDGVLYVHSPASREHERLFAFLFSLMKSYADERGLGEVLGSRMTMDIAPSRKFEPDIMFVRTENLDRLGEKALQGPADMVVEILSESTRRLDLTIKREAYRKAGVPEIWFVDPDERRVIVDRRKAKGYSEETIKSGRVKSEAMPGFWVKSSWLWGEGRPSVVSSLQELLGRSDD